MICWPLDKNQAAILHRSLNCSVNVVRFFAKLGTSSFVFDESSKVKAVQYVGDNALSAYCPQSPPHPDRAVLLVGRTELATELFPLGSRQDLTKAVLPRLASLV